MNYTTLASKLTVEKTIKSLNDNNINTELVQTGEEAQKKILKLIPPNAQVMTMTSVTLDQTGLTDILNQSEKYLSVKHQLIQLNRETDHLKMQQLGAAPEWAVGSVQAVTEDGQILIVSNTGSQLAAYVYGAANVVWVVSTKKIVKNLDEGFNRIHHHIVPLETVRARKAYGLPETWNTFPSKIVTINREAAKGRTNLIFVNQDLGF